MTRFSVQRHYSALQPLIAISQNVHTAGRLEPALIELVLMRVSQDRKSTRLNSSHKDTSRMPSSA